MTREYDRSLGAGAEIAWLTPGRGEVPRLGTANIHLVSSLGTGYRPHSKPQSTVTVKIQCKANIFNLAYFWATSIQHCATICAAAQSWCHCSGHSSCLGWIVSTGWSRFRFWREERESPAGAGAAQAPLPYPPSRHQPGHSGIFIMNCGDT